MNMKLMTDAELRDMNRAIVREMNLRFSAKEQASATKFNIGDTVSVESHSNRKGYRKLIGEIIKINEKTIRVKTATCGLFTASPSLLKLEKKAV